MAKFIDGSNIQPGPDLSRYGQLVTEPPILFPHDGTNGLPFPDFPDPLGLGAKAVAATGLFKVPEGRNVGKPFSEVLMPSQRAQIIALFGHVDPVTSTRYINFVFDLEARKNAKSTKSALISILEMLSGREPNAEIVVLAATVVQARVIFSQIRKILETNPKIAALCRLQDHLHMITYTGPSRQKATISVTSTAKPGALHGRSISLLLVDELHALEGEKGVRAYSALTTSMGARKAPRVIITTTQSDNPRALNKGEIFRELYDKAMAVRDGKVQDGRFLPIIFMPGKNDDWRSEDTWRKVNPGIEGGILDISELREEYERAKDSPMLANAFKCLRLNIEPANAAGNAWLEPTLIETVVGEVEWEEFASCDLRILGIDLASVDDICSGVMLGINDDQFIARGIHALGSDAFDRYTNEAPELRHFEAEGDLYVAPGGGVDLTDFANEVIDLALTHGANAIAIDPAMANLVTQQLEAAGLQVFHVRQGAISMTPGLAWVEQVMLAKRIRLHPGLLPWAFKNCIIVRRGEARAVTRENGMTPRKIDPAVALLCCAILHLSGELQVENYSAALSFG